MRSLDVVLQVLMEEGNEVAVEASGLSNTASKSLRFGYDSVHHRGLFEGRTAGERMLAHYHAMRSETIDATAMLYLAIYFAEGKEKAMVFMQENAGSFLVRGAITMKITRFLRHAKELIGQGSLAQQEYDHLLTTCLEAIEPLKP